MSVVKDTSVTETESDSVASETAKSTEPCKNKTSAPGVVAKEINVSFQASSFMCWRDRNEEARKPPADVNALKQLLANKQKVVNSCNLRTLPDGGQRLIEQINNLKLQIGKEEDGNQSNKTHQNANLSPSKQDQEPVANSKTVAWAGPPSVEYKEKEVPNSRINKTKENGLSNSRPDSSKPIIWAEPPTINAQHLVTGTKIYSSNVPMEGVDKSHAAVSSSDPRSSKHIQIGLSVDSSNRHDYNIQHNNCQIDNIKGGPYSSTMTSNVKRYGMTKSGGGGYSSHLRQTLLTEPHAFWTRPGCLPARTEQLPYNIKDTTVFRSANVKTVTEDAVMKLYKCLDGCPGPEVQVLAPTGLLTSMMPHQRQALAWLLWREDQDPAGGILADDMGLGKTFTLITLILKKNQLASALKKETGISDGKDLVKSQGTLVICLASLLHQWEKEINIHCEKDTLKVHLYHGLQREKEISKLASYDIVITTYAILTKEAGNCKENENNDNESSTMASPLFNISWERIILDEAHTIKNPKSKCCSAVCHLETTYRWALTGTPIHNDLLDMYALLRFLRASPFDELKVWKTWVGNRTTQGKERLSALIKSLLLRRTKDQLDRSGKPLVQLPKKTSVIHDITLSSKERTVYDELDKYFRSTLNNILLKKAGDSSEEKKDGYKGSQALIFTLLLRLQQTCNHLSLLHQAVQDSVDSDPEDLVSQLESLSLEQKSTIPDFNGEVLSLAKYKTDKAFDRASDSSKITSLLKELKKIIKVKEKSVIVSQWASMLSVVAHHLKHLDIPYALIQGDVPVKSRMTCIDNFNNTSHNVQVMLLSLKAGGVGLNLTGGNHLFLLDVHCVGLQKTIVQRLQETGSFSPRKKSGRPRTQTGDEVSRRSVELVTANTRTSTRAVGSTVGASHQCPTDSAWSSLSSLSRTSTPGSHGQGP